MLHSCRVHDRYGRGSWIDGDFNLGLSAAVTATVAPRSVRAQDYDGPNVILVRFGGGVRRAETIDEATTFAPYLRHVLAGRGVFIPDMRIAQLDGVNTSHAEGTLNLLTGRYLAYRDAGSRFLRDRLGADRTDAVRVPARGVRPALAPSAPDQW